MFKPVLNSFLNFKLIHFFESFKQKPYNQSRAPLMIYWNMSVPPDTILYPHLFYEMYYIEMYYIDIIQTDNRTNCMIQLASRRFHWIEVENISEPSDKILTRTLGSFRPKMYSSLSSKSSTPHLSVSSSRTETAHLERLGTSVSVLNIKI